jgi:transposase-like protein
MTHTISPPHIITCPVCGSEDEWLEHDVRCSLRYTCKRCEHEWQIDPADEVEPDSVWDDWFPRHGIR